MNGLLQFLGFFDRALFLDARARNALQIPDAVVSAHIAQGPGALRGLALVLPESAELRQTLTAVGHALAREAPQLLWLVTATQTSNSTQAIFCWSASSTKPRIQSLVCDRDHLYESDSETLCALASAAGESDLLTHSRWLDILGREAITRRFFRTLQQTISQVADSAATDATRDESRELALLCISRLIFLSFLETKGWLDGDFGFLVNGYADCLASGGKYQKRVLEPLFFGTLNTPSRARSPRARRFGRIPFLNGGLFSRSSLEKRRRECAFSDEAFGYAFGDLLSRYRFSGREESTLWSEASIDPEILGKAFEALMAANDRKSSGAFYTPQSLVEDVVSDGLASLLTKSAHLNEIKTIRILDPACGSGAFLVHVLDRLAALRVEAGDTGTTADVKRNVLATSIFGVDINPMAVWLCELRLWLAIVIESPEADPMRVVPLPNLDRHIRVGDSLSGGAFVHAPRRVSGQKLMVLRDRYMRASGPRKKTLARAMDGAERTFAIETLRREHERLTHVRRELLAKIRSKDLFGERHGPDRVASSALRDLRVRIRSVAKRERLLAGGAALPFSFAAHFSDVAAAGGFNLIVGNPPWVRLHAIPESSRERLRSEFAVYRGAAWESGAAAAGAGRGFSAQVDMAALFVERSCDLLRPEGSLALLLPSKLWRSLAGGGVRRLLTQRMQLTRVSDMSASKSQFDAAVYPSLIVARKMSAIGDPDSAPSVVTRQTHTRKCAAAISVGLADREVSWTVMPASLPFDGTSGSPWVLLPPDARSAFEKLRDVARPFSSIFGPPLLGVKSGCNAAYVVLLESVDGDNATISSGGRHGLIERELLRRVVRGESLSAWQLTRNREYLIWLHDLDGSPRKTIPPLARKWLEPFRDQLAARVDLRGRIPWWAVFRTESARHDFPRVVWADFGVAPRALVIDASDATIPLNSCYASLCDTREDAYALAALLNSPVASAWLNVLAEPARGGYRRYLGWTMSLLPIPNDWPRARVHLGPLGQRGTAGEILCDAELLEATLEAYGLSATDMEPLLSWTARCD
jgi:Eco57I restriction-modification methylase